MFFIILSLHSWKHLSKEVDTCYTFFIENETEMLGDLGENSKASRSSL